jgi:hypothetical protein
MNLILLVLLVPLALTIGTNAYALSDIDRWQSGYDHGCDDARGGGHAYLNTHPTHTKIFMGGYEDGYQDCKGQKILEEFMPCLWPDCYYPTDNPARGEDDNCRLPNCFLDLND